MNLAFYVKSNEELQILNQKFCQHENKYPAIYVVMHNHIYPHDLEEVNFLKDAGYLLIQLLDTFSM